MEENEWVQPIAEQYLLGISHVLEYIKSEAYRMYVFNYILCFLVWIVHYNNSDFSSNCSMYNRYVSAGRNGAAPPKADRSKKASRNRN